MTETDLYEAVASLIDRGVEDSGDREQLARQLLTRQFKKFPAWGRLQRARQIKSVRPGLHAIRPFPVQLYKSLPAVAQQGDCIFETSGTSNQTPGRVVYSPRDLYLMQLAIDRSAAVHLFADGNRSTQMVILAPSPAERPSMIMAHGMQRLGTRFCTRADFYVQAGAMDLAGVLSTMAAACAEGRPLTLAGGSFAFVGLADHLIATNRTLTLPAGSRILDAGGTKGRSRDVTRSEFRTLMERAFGVPANWQVNLLGMTELGSQFYDHVIGQPRQGAGQGKHNDPWTQTWVVDPISLEPLPEGATGLLVHLDLANFDHPACILTEDLGYATPDGFEIEGRARGADLRGCALVMEEFKQQQAQL